MRALWCAWFHTYSDKLVVRDVLTVTDICLITWENVCRCALMAARKIQSILVSYTVNKYISLAKRFADDVNAWPTKRCGDSLTYSFAHSLPDSFTHGLKHQHSPGSLRAVIAMAFIILKSMTWHFIRNYNIYACNSLRGYQAAVISGKAISWIKKKLNLSTLMGVNAPM